MHYLTHNPLAGNNYECRFDIDLLKFPPSMYPGTRDPYITFGDTEARMALAFPDLREMTGSRRGARSRTPSGGASWATSATTAWPGSPLTRSPAT